MFRRTLLHDFRKAVEARTGLFWEDFAHSESLVQEASYEAIVSQMLNKRAPSYEVYVIAYKPLAKLCRIEFSPSKLPDKLTVTAQPGIDDGLQPTCRGHRPARRLICGAVTTSAIRRVTWSHDADATVDHLDDAVAALGDARIVGDDEERGVEVAVEAPHQRGTHHRR